jgi:serine/threonine protein kinase
MDPAERYTIVKKIADGGMAEIFLATQSGAQGFRRNVILKRILPALSEDPQLRNMLVDEAHIAMSLNHGNIVQILDLGEAGGRTFLVLEVVDGWDLATILARAEAVALPFPTALALYTTAEVCRALAYAHSKTRDGKPLGIVHRDVSPENVLISEQGEIKLADFGIAKAMDKRERTRTGVIKGKLDFMSPEQAAGEKLDARSDLFSTGALLYLMATGQRPFRAMSDLDVLLRVRKADFVAPDKAYSHIHSEVARIIKNAMKKQPARRYASANQMMVQVETLLRQAFDSAGQSEFARWLHELAARDGMPTVVRRQGLSFAPDLSADPLFEGTIVALREPTPITDLALQPTQLRSDPPLSGEPAGDRAQGPAPNGVSRRPGKILHRIGVYPIVFALSLAAAAIGFRLLVPSVAHKATTGIKTGTLSGKGAAPLSSPGDDLPTRPLPAADPHASGRSADRTHESSSPMVLVRFVTRPKGARVRSGSHTLGSTPLQRDFPGGVRAEFSFTKPGYVSVKRMFTVGTSDTTIAVDLDKKAKKRRTTRHRGR